MTYNWKRYKISHIENKNAFFFFDSQIVFFDERTQISSVVFSKSGRMVHRQKQTSQKSRILILKFFCKQIKGYYLLPQSLQLGILVWLPWVCCPESPQDEHRNHVGLSWNSSSSFRFTQVFIVFVLFLDILNFFF